METTSKNIHLSSKRQHPADTIFRFIKTVKETILGLGIGSIALIRQSPKYALLFIGVYFLIMLVIGFFSWLRHTYRVEEGELRVEQGVFIRKKSYISVNRIHTIDFTANVLHRILNLVRVSVMTADGESETTFMAVKREDAEKLRHALKQGKTQEMLEDDNQDVVSGNLKKSISWKHLFLAGMTSGSAGFLIIGGLFLFSQIQEAIPDGVYEDALDYLIQLSIILIFVLFLLGLIGLWLLGTLGTVIKFGGFTIEKREDELFIKRGLLETKEISIPYDRIQAIEVQQSILRKPLKFSRVIAVTAGSSEQSEGANPIIFPMIPDREVASFLQKYVPDYEGADQELIPLDRKGLKYYLFKHSFLFILALILVAYFFPTFSWIPGVFVLLSLGLGWLKFTETGYRIDGNRIMLRNWHLLTRSSTIFYRRRVQAYEQRQHKLQQIERIATADFSIISLGAQAVIRHLDKEDAHRIGDWHSRRKD